MTITSASSIMTMTMTTIDPNDSIIHNATNHSDEDYEYVEEEEDLSDAVIGIVVPVVFSIVFVFGLVGNAVLVYTVLRDATLRTKPNILIVSLAIGDFLLILISVPVTATIFSTQEWWYGGVMCKMNEFFQTLSLGVSVFTLVALSYDRFVAIVYPLATYSSSSRCKVIAICIVIWYISIGLAVMDFVSAHVKSYPSKRPFDVCHLYPDEWKGYKDFRLIFRFVIFFLIPVLVMAVLYGIIAVVLLRKRTHTASDGTTTTMNSSSRPGMNGGTTPGGITRQVSSRRRVAKVVLSFVVIFVVCWLPRHIYVLAWHYDLILDYNVYIHLFKIVGFCLTFIYSSLNPVVLCLLNAEFRSYFKHYLFGCCCKSARYRRGSRAMSLSADGAGWGTRRGTGLGVCGPVGGLGGGGRRLTNGGGRLVGRLRDSTCVTGLTSDQTMTTPDISLEDLRDGAKRVLN